jgi:hypothetical protein
MGESADQTRAEIVELRAEMTRRVADLRRAAERPLKVAKTAAVGVAGVIALGTVALVARKIRRSREEKTFRGRARLVADAVTHPSKTRDRAGKAVGEQRDRVKRGLRKEFHEELKEAKPLHEKLLEMAAKTAATTAVGYILKNVADTTGGKDGEARARTSEKERAAGRS